MTDQNATIVLLEDDASFRGLLSGGLREAGYPVAEAATRAQAMEALSAANGRVILVADRTVDPDGPNGFQIAAEALETFPELRVVYISGTHIAIRRRTLGERERALLKPFAVSQLLTALRELGG